MNFILLVFFVLFFSFISQAPSLRVPCGMPSLQAWASKVKSRSPVWTTRAVQRKFWPMSSLQWRNLKPQRKRPSGLPHRPNTTDTWAAYLLLIITEWSQCLQWCSGTLTAVSSSLSCTGVICILSICLFGVRQRRRGLSCTVLNCPF